MQLRLAAVHCARTSVVAVLCGQPTVLGRRLGWWHDALYSSDRTPGPVGCFGLRGAMHGEHGCQLGVCVHVPACQRLLHDDAPNRGVAFELL